ncbi:MAG: Hsp33 family molecular chaperone HslO [Halioglobus sp.]|nr:Hsp33 family molecular chaperone HslO [Halioglobus sp.]
MSRSPADQSQRFLFEEADIRGESVRLGATYREILAIHEYAPGVSRLMGEFLAASVLLSNNLKFTGRLILQARSAGQVPLLMAECNNTLGVRGIARGAEEATASDNTLLLAGGQLVITIEPDKGQRYQGIVPIESGSLAASIDAYFEQSEQLRTRLWLAADGECAGGLLLQQLPAQVVPAAGPRADQWQHACTLAATVEEDELLTLHTQSLLGRLYHEDALRLFDPSPVRFECTCSRERTLNALSTLDPAEIEDILLEMGAVTMDCEFCQARYIFQREDLQELPGINQSKTLH